MKREFRISCASGRKELILEAYGKLKTPAEKRQFKKINRITTDQLKNWRRPSRRKIIKENASRRSTKGFYMSAASRMKKRVGYFAAQEAALFKKFKLRRIQGLAIDGEWFKTEMKLLVQESDHPRKDQFKGSDHWLSKFCRRNGLSSQRKTNKKSKSILERLPKIKNFHYYTVYKMGLEKF